MAQRITMEEYNNSDYTKNALRELNEQMKTFKFKTTKESKEDQEDDITSTECDFDSEPKKVIIVPSGSRKRKSRSANKNMHADTRIEDLQNRIDKLRTSLNKQSADLDTAEIRLYQKTLELSNSQVELDSAKDKIIRLNITNKNLTSDLFFTNLKYYSCITLNIAFFCYTLYTSVVQPTTDSFE
jgi:hypothetical protein